MPTTATVVSVLDDGLKDALLMAYEVWWALVLGFAISAVVQSWVPRERVQAQLGGSGPLAIARSTGLGAASSSCSYAAVAIGRSLFAKGASGASALAFQFASTNLVVELGIVLWLLIGWQFAVAELAGGVLLIALMTVSLRVFVSRRLESQAREHARSVQSGHHHHGATGRPSVRSLLTSRQAWSGVAQNFRHDWSMLWKEICAGFLLAGFVAQMGNGFFRSLFIADAPATLRTVENVVAGPVIAVLSFVCSIGNVPLAAVLWSGGISFGGVVAFLFADLIVLPIVLIYRKYYGWRFAWRITALMLVAMIVAALGVDGLFTAAGLVPASRPTRGEVFGSVRVDYKLILDLVATAVFACLLALSRGGGRDHAAPHEHGTATVPAG